MFRTASLYAHEKQDAYTESRRFLFFSTVIHEYELYYGVRKIYATLKKECGRNYCDIKFSYFLEKILNIIIDFSATKNPIIHQFIEHLMLLTTVSFPPVPSVPSQLTFSCSFSFVSSAYSTKINCSESCLYCIANLSNISLILVYLTFSISLIKLPLCHLACSPYHLLTKSLGTRIVCSSHNLNGFPYFSLSNSRHVFVKCLSRSVKPKSTLPTSLNCIFIVDVPLKFEPSLIKNHC